MVPGQSGKCNIEGGLADPIQANADDSGLRALAVGSFMYGALPTNAVLGVGG